MSKQDLLDSDFLRSLERMKVMNKSAMSGITAGKRRSRQLGSSIEFADYRAYTPGDDLRQLDWNVYARLGKLFLKTFLDEQELHISLYIDTSHSMTYGEPSKFRRSLQLAGALGFLSLHHFDRVSVYAFDEGVQTSLKELSGKGKVHQLFHFLQALKSGKTGDVNKALRSGRAVHGKPGISIVFSDFLFENGYEEGLRFIQAANQEVILVHLLVEEERNPLIQGDLRLVDSETGSGREVALTPPVLKAYKRSVRQFQQELASFAFGRGMIYLDIHPEETVEHIIHHVFRHSGVLR